MTVIKDYVIVSSLINKKVTVSRRNYLENKEECYVLIGE